MDVLQIKLMSALIHAEEFIETNEEMDLHAFKASMTDQDIVELRADLAAQALLPVKR